MKTYIVYIDGAQIEYIKAGSHNAAERKARKRWPEYEHARITVVYTEI